MSMIWKILSFDGLDLDPLDGSYFAYLDDAQNQDKQPKVNAGMVSRGNYPPAAGGVELTGDSMVVTVICSNNSDTLVDPLIKYFNTTEESERVLVGEDRNGDEWYVMARPTRHISKKGVIHQFPMQVLDRVWRSVTALEETWTVIASGQTQNLVVGGNQYAYPVITLSPQGPKSGDYANRRFIEILNPTDRAMVDYYLDVSGQTGKQLDTAALTTAKMQADGDDIRLVMDGKEIYYWLTDMDTDHTGIHTAEIPLAPRIELTLSGNIASSGAITTITVKSTPANKAALIKLKSVSNKVLRIKTGSDIERFTFTSVNEIKYQITGVTRAQKLTSEAAHSDGDTIKWVEHDLWLLYGNATAEAMIVDENRKPMQSLANSTNLLWAWTEFYDSEVARPGAWTKAPIKTVNRIDPAHTSDYYTGNQDGTASNPAAELGMRMMAWMQSGKWKGESATLAFDFYDPSGITDVTFTDGEKKRVGASWPALAALQRSTNGKTYYTVAKELTPASAGSFTATTVLTGKKSLGTTSQYVKIMFAGSIALTADNAVYLEFGGISNDKSSSLIPEINLSAEESNYQNNTTMVNETTGDEMTLRYPCGLGDIITIDVPNRKVTHSSGAEILGALTRSGEWMRLKPGVTNVFRVDDAGIADVDFAVAWEDRMLG